MPHMSLNSSYHWFFGECKNSQTNETGKEEREKGRERKEEEAEAYTPFFKNHTMMVYPLEWINEGGLLCVIANRAIYETSLP